MIDENSPETRGIDPNPAASTAPAEDRTSGLAIAALVLGIAGFCALPPLSIVALILGFVALAHIADPHRRLSGRGMAITGIVLGFVELALTLVFLALILIPASGAAQDAAKSIRDSSNLRQIGIAIIAYAVDNDGIMPEHPRDITTYLGGATQDLFISHHHDPNTTLDRGDTNGPAIRYGSYVFLLSGTSRDEIDSPADTVLAYTAKVSEKQRDRAVLFADGHAERVMEEDLQDILPMDIDAAALDGP